MGIKLKYMGRELKTPCPLFSYDNFQKLLWLLFDFSGRFPSGKKSLRNSRKAKSPDEKRFFHIFATYFLTTLSCSSFISIHATILYISHFMTCIVRVFPYSSNALQDNKQRRFRMSNINFWPLRKTICFSASFLIGSSTLTSMWSISQSILN